MTTFILPMRLTGSARAGALAASFCFVLIALVVSAEPAHAQGGIDVAVNKTAPNIPYFNGSNVEYTITVGNNGPSSAMTVQLRDTIPVSMAFVSISEPAGWNCATPPPGGRGEIICATSVMLPATAVEFTLVLRVVGAPDQLITNTATVSSTLPDPVPANNTSSVTFRVGGFSRDTAGVYDPATGTFFLKNTNAQGPADFTFTFGPSDGSVIPIRGDWNGDGIDTIGVYNPTTGTFFLRNTNTPGQAEIKFRYGAANAGLLPITGDWNGDGIDTIGVYNPVTGTFFLRNSNTAGSANIKFRFGAANAGFVPIAGDWDNDFDDSVGLYDPATATFFLKFTNSAGDADLNFSYGPEFATPLAGDWDNNGSDTIGVYVSATGQFLLRTANSPGDATFSFFYGGPGRIGLTGDWNGL